MQLTREQRKKFRDELDKELNLLSVLDPIEDRNAYDYMLCNIGRVKSMMNPNPGKGIDINTLLQILGSIGAILLIMNYEKTDVITTKAFGFIKKM